MSEIKVVKRILKQDPVKGTWDDICKILSPDYAMHSLEASFYAMIEHQDQFDIYETAKRLDECIANLTKLKDKVDTCIRCRPTFK